jgi:hypothetical protein
MLQPSVQNLLHTIHLGAEQLALFAESLIDALLEIAELLVESFLEIVKPLPMICEPPIVQMPTRTVSVGRPAPIAAIVT